MLTLRVNPATKPVSRMLSAAGASVAGSHCFTSYPAARRIVRRVVSWVAKTCRITLAVSDRVADSALLAETASSPRGLLAALQTVPSMWTASSLDGSRRKRSARATAITGAGVSCEHDWQHRLPDGRECWLVMSAAHGQRSEPDGICGRGALCAVVRACVVSNRARTMIASMRAGVRIAVTHVTAMLRASGQPVAGLMGCAVEGGTGMLLARIDVVLDALNAHAMHCAGWTALLLCTALSAYW